MNRYAALKWQEKKMQCVASAQLPTPQGLFDVHVFQKGEDGQEHIVLSMGEPADGCLVRLHSECATGDILGSLRCDCGNQLGLALEEIAREGQGLFVYGS